MSAVDQLLKTMNVPAPTGSAVDRLLSAKATPATPTKTVSASSTPVKPTSIANNSSTPATINDNFLSDFISSLPENLVRGIGLGLGAVLDIPKAASDLYAQNYDQGYQGYTGHNFSLSDVATGVLQTAKSLSQGTFNVVASPAIGAVEAATGQNVGTVKTPLGDFQSPQSAVDQLLQSGVPRGEAIATIGANQAVSAGMLVGAASLGAPKGAEIPKTETLTPEAVPSPAAEVHPTTSVPLDANSEIKNLLNAEMDKPMPASDMKAAEADIKSLTPESRLESTVNDILKGKLKMQVGTDLKTEKLSTLGGGRYANIFRNNPNLDTLDVVAHNAGVSSDVLLQAITDKASGKSIQLNSGIDPGIDKLYGQDIKPAITGAGKIIKEAKNAFNPAGASPEAQATADMVRKSNATMANASALEAVKYKGVTDAFTKLSNEQNIGNISNYERTGKFNYEPIKGYSEFYKASTDAAHQILNEVYKNPVDYVENYVRRQYDFASPADQQAGVRILQDRANSLYTNKSPTKGRTLNMPLDDALKTMRDAGIDVKPVTTNPELIRQWTVANAQHAQLFEGLKKLLNETNDPNVARILENVTSKGLSNSPTYKGIRALNNSMSQIQLGFSAFHGVGTAINAGISDLALGADKLIHGDVSGIGDIGRSAVPGYSFVRDMINGKSFINDLKEGNPTAAKILEDKINPGGARLRLDETYTNKSYENMVKAFKDGNVVGGVARMPLATIEQISRPLMSYAIPRVKVGAYLDLVNAFDKAHPEATAAEQARGYAQSWDSIDNRFGQLTYDNLFWNKTAKDLSMIATRSVGWNLGTIRELGGGIVDATKGQITPRALYTAALPIYVGSIGAIYQYIHTGKGPSSLTDYFYPKNGLQTAYGQPDRVSLPTYMKDVYAYATNPISTVENKASPLISLAYQLSGNHDYYGDLIRNPNDSKAQQLEQVGSYLLDAIKPFSFQSAEKLKGASVGQKAESFFGFTKAPAKIIDPTYNPTPSAPKTPEQKDMAALVKKANAEIPQGNMTTFNQLKAAGYFNTGSPRKTALKEMYFIQDAKMSPAAREASYQKYLKAKTTK